MLNSYSSKVNFKILRKTYSKTYVQSLHNLKNWHQHFLRKKLNLKTYVWVLNFTLSNIGFLWTMEMAMEMENIPLL